jgi:superfamily II RNA helicase
MESLKQKNKELGISQEELVEFFEWDKLKNEVQSSVNAKRKKATKLLTEWEDNHSGSNWNRLKMLYATWKKNDSDLYELSEQLRQLSQSSKNVQKKIDFLHVSGYLDEGKPTLTGILATEANEANGLLLASAIISSESKELDCEELICLLAGFLGESEKGLEDGRSKTLHLSNRVEMILCQVDDWAEELIQLENRHGSESSHSYWKLQAGWIDITRRWYNGEDASAICAEYGIYEGNFIRAMLKLGNILEEWMNMLTYLMRTEQLERYKDLKDCILRGVVKPQSLYLTL